MVERKGRNGGTLKSMEPGESANPNGRPKGSTSLKIIADKILDGIVSVEEAPGVFKKMTRREAMIIGIVNDALNDEDPNIRMKAAQILMDRTEGKADQTLNIAGGLSVGSVGELDPAKAEKLLSLIKGG